MPKSIILAVLFTILQTSLHAQARKTTTKAKAVATTNSASLAIKERAFAQPSDQSEITDLKRDQPAFEAVKMLLDFGVIMIYFDHKFRGSENLKRGDFAVHFNSTLESVRRFMDSVKQDTSLINTYDKHRSYITSVSEIKDLKPGSVYYSAVQALLEKWGIAAMFTKLKKLNANSTVSEAEAYDILHVTMGYNNSAISKRMSAVKREAFAAMLAEAVTQISQRIIRLPVRLPDVSRDTFYIQQPYDSTKKLNY